MVKASMTSSRWAWPILPGEIVSTIVIQKEHIISGAGGREYVSVQVSIFILF